MPCKNRTPPSLPSALSPRAFTLIHTQDRTTLHHHYLDDNEPRKRCQPRKQERKQQQETSKKATQDNQAIGDKPCNFPMVWSSQRAAGEKIQGLRSMIIIHHSPPLNHKMRKRSYLGESTSRKDNQQASLAACTITNDNEFSSKFRSHCCKPKERTSILLINMFSRA